MMVRRISDLGDDKCSACALCIEICPVNCITMGADLNGFLRPQIDDSACINCGLCAKSCVILNPEKMVKPVQCFAAVRIETEKILKSSSGGIFAAMAEHVISKGGAVCGCALDSELNPRHFLTQDSLSVCHMYGSKYVQSEMGNIYREVNKYLLTGKIVLFSGTPCQVAAVKRFTKNPTNLITVELICHGVANKRMFLSYLEKYNREKIKMYIFRDKSQGWTFNGKIIYKNGKTLNVNHRLSSYMSYYLRGETYRDSCYNCPYANPDRCADLTIGDFWGIVRQRPDLKDKINISLGVSCVMVNTQKGGELFCQSKIRKYEVDYEDVKKGNAPLNAPSSYSYKRNQILKEWKKSYDWNDVHKLWKATDYKWFYSLWSKLPKTMQHNIRLMLGKR